VRRVSDFIGEKWLSKSDGESFYSLILAYRGVSEALVDLFQQGRYHRQLFRVK